MKNIASENAAYQVDAHTRSLPRRDSTEWPAMRDETHISIEPLVLPKHFTIREQSNWSLSTTRRVYLSFVRNNGWRCRFHEGDIAKKPISRLYTFRDEEKIFEMARRGHGLTDELTREALKQAISVGHGGIWLTLTEKQYSLVKSSGSDIR